MGITLKNNKQVTKNMTIKGDAGVGIKTITSGTPVVTEEKTTTPITVTLTDETTQNFNVEAKNGSGADNALTKPTTAPSATQIVTVDNTNTQTMLNIGDGLSVENGSLKASGGGGNLYLKEISLTMHDAFESGNISFINFSYFSKNNNTPQNISTLIDDIINSYEFDDHLTLLNLSFTLSRQCPVNINYLPIKITLTKPKKFGVTYHVYSFEANVLDRQEIRAILSSENVIGFSSLVSILK